MSLKVDISCEELECRLGENIPVMIEKERVSGVSVALIRDRDCVFAAGFGVRDAYTGASVTKDTIFEAYSCTKPLVAYRALQLCDAGVLALDRPLADYLTDPWISHDPKIRQITLRMVLSHTSGLPDGEQDVQVGFAPGTRWSYSTVGFYYLQHVIEQISGVPFEQAMHEYVLKPLAMNASSFVWQDGFLSRMAHGHDKQGISQAVRRITVADADSLLTTPSDYARFMMRIMSVCRIDASYSGEQCVSQMLEKQVGLNGKLSWGFQHREDGDCFWHFGGGEGAPFQNFALAFQDAGIGVVVLTNSANGEAVFEDIVTLTIGGRYPVFPWRRFVERYFKN